MSQAKPESSTGSMESPAPRRSPLSIQSGEGRPPGVGASTAESGVSGGSAGPALAGIPPSRIRASQSSCPSAPPSSGSAPQAGSASWACLSRTRDSQSGTSASSAPPVSSPGASAVVSFGVPNQSGTSPGGGPSSDGPTSRKRPSQSGEPAESASSSGAFSSNSSAPDPALILSSQSEASAPSSVPSADMREPSGSPPTTRGRSRAPQNPHSSAPGGLSLLHIGQRSPAAIPLVPVRPVGGHKHPQAGDNPTDCHAEEDAPCPSGRRHLDYPVPDP